MGAEFLVCSRKKLNINIYTRNEGSRVKFSKIFVSAKLVFLKSVGAAAPTAPTLTRPMHMELYDFYIFGILTYHIYKHERDLAGPEVYLPASEQALVRMGARASIEISHFVLDIKNYQL